MKLRETYNASQKLDMLQGLPIGFLSHIFNPTDNFISNTSGIYNGYFLRSNNKTTSPVFDEFYEQDFGEAKYPTFRPYAINNNDGTETYDENANVSDYISISDFVEIHLRNEYLALDQYPYPYNARWYCYDSNFNYLGYRSNYYYNREMFVNTFPNIAYVKFVILLFNFETVLYEPIDCITVNRNIEIYFDKCVLNSKQYEKYLGKLIRGKFIYKWEREFEALYSKYNAVDDFSKNRELNDKTENEKTYGKTSTVTGGENLTKSYNSSISDDYTKTVEGSKNEMLSFDDELPRIDTETITFDNRKDENKKSFSDRKDKEIESYPDGDYTETNTFTYDGGSDKLLEYEKRALGGSDTISHSFKEESIDKAENQDYVYGFNSSSAVSSDKSDNRNASLVERDAENNQDKTTFGKTETLTGGHTEELIKSGSIQHEKEYSGTETESITKTGTETRSLTKSGAEYTDITYGDTTTDSGTKTHSGTDTNNLTKNETETNSGTDKENIERKLEDNENGFNANPSDNIRKVLELNDMYIFYDIIYKDIDSIITLQIYA